LDKTLKMRIAVLAHLHYPIAQPYAGGMETHTALLVHELQRQGHDVTLYAAAGSDSSLNVVPIFEDDAKRGNSPGIKCAYREALAQIAAEPYDYVINNTLNTVPIESLAGTNMPVLTIFHSPPIDEIVALGSDILEADNMSYAAVSHITASQWVAKMNVDVKVVHNGINMKKWLPTYAASKQNYVAWSGRITPEKGTHMAIEAALLLHIPIKVAGTVYDKKYFDKVITPLLQRPNVDYVGHLKVHELNAHYGHAKAALVIEALASGTPVAAINNGAMPEIITSRVGSLAHEATSESLAEAVRMALMKDPNKCIEHVQKQFTIKTMVDRYIQIMERGIGQSDSTRHADQDDVRDDGLVRATQLV
jgi:UDP-glucose:tetrahydrobiopterin glucosyltransferase